MTLPENLDFIHQGNQEWGHDFPSRAVLDNLTESFCGLFNVPTQEYAHSAIFFVVAINYASRETGELQLKMPITLELWIEMFNKHLFPIIPDEIRSFSIEVYEFVIRASKDEIDRELLEMTLNLSIEDMMNHYATPDYVAEPEAIAV